MPLWMSQVESSEVLTGIHRFVDLVYFCFIHLFENDIISNLCLNYDSVEGIHTLEIQLHLQYTRRASAHDQSNVKTYFAENQLSCTSTLRRI